MSEVDTSKHLAESSVDVMDCEDPGHSVVRGKEMLDILSVEEEHEMETL